MGSTSDDSPWIVKDVVIRQEVGTHLRVVKRVHERANGLDAEVVLTSADHRANARSLLDLMQLAGRTGDTIRVEARGPDAERVVSFVVQLLEADRWDAEITDG